MTQILPKQITQLVDEFAKLPSIGPKTAERLTMYLVRFGDPDRLGEALQQLRAGAVVQVQQAVVAQVLGALQRPARVAPQLRQCDRLKTTSSSAGRRTLTAARKLPTISPNNPAVAAKTTGLASNSIIRRRNPA